MVSGTTGWVSMCGGSQILQSKQWVAVRLTGGMRIKGQNSTDATCHGLHLPHFLESETCVGRFLEEEKVCLYYRAAKRGRKAHIVLSSGRV